MKTTMTRFVNAKERFYSIELIANLFGEVLLIRTFGSVNRIKPTGVIQQIHSDRYKAEASMKLLILDKKKKGYSPYPSCLVQE